MLTSRLPSFVVNLRVHEHKRSRTGDVIVNASPQTGRHERERNALPLEALFTLD